MAASRFDRWIRAYVRAWRSDDPRDVGALFAKNAVYATGPFDAEWRGRTKIVSEWIARGDSKIRFRFTYEVVASSGSVGIIRGTTTYAASRGLPKRVYGNLWIVRLNRRGEAEEFRKWWMQRR